MLEILHVHTPEEATALCDLGFEPIECAFGTTSVLGAYAMDHHGTEAWREGVAIRACRDHYGVLAASPKFVGTGLPDADAVLAIVALAGLVPREQIPASFAELVNRTDLSPIRADLHLVEYGPQLLLFKQFRAPKGVDGWYAAVGEMCRILRGVSPDELEAALAAETARVQQADTTPVLDLGCVGVVMKSPVWGYDRWYRKHPVIVALTPANQITIGVVSDQKAEELFGEGGLLAVFPRLNQGWGGRASVGGSPRGVPCTEEDLMMIAQEVQDLIEEKETP